MSLALSIIIPVYNCEKTIRKCLDSIFIQKNDLKYEYIFFNRKIWEQVQPEIRL